MRQNEADVIITPSARRTKKTEENIVRQMLRSFNAECDNIILNISLKNIDSSKRQIQKSFETINRLYLVDSAYLSDEFLKVKLEQATLMYTYELKRQQEKEIQKEIKEQMIEEAKAQREIEEQKKKIDKDLQQFTGEVNKLMKYLQKTQNDAEKELYTEKIRELEERIKELQVDNYVFTSQYQQEPIVLGGQVIKRDWFGYYNSNEKYNYNKIIIAADTAISAKEHADYSCFLVGGVTAQNKLHILEMVHGKWEYPELKQQAISLFNRWQLDKRSTSASSIVIEDRASGQQLLQDFKKAGLPVKPIEVTKDKLSRVEEVLDYIANGNVMLPDNEQYSNNPRPERYNAPAW